MCSRRRGRPIYRLRRGRLTRSCRRGRNRNELDNANEEKLELNDRLHELEMMVRNQREEERYRDESWTWIQFDASQIAYFLCFLSFCLLIAFFYFHSQTVLYLLSPFLRVLAPSRPLQSSSKEALAKKCMDHLLRSDYALDTAGGSVLSSSRTYFAVSSAMYRTGRISPLYSSFSPNEVIRADVQPGQCWAMDGTSGHVTIQLAMPVIVRAISIDHIPKELISSGRLYSAPKDFMIIGKDGTVDDPGIVLGIFTYDINKEPVQVFDIKDPYCVHKFDGGTCGPNNKVFYILTLKILSNHGNPEFTCIYRVRVHGQAHTFF